MKIVFNGQTLADHTATPATHAIIEQWGGQSVVQTEKRYGQNTEIDFPRGNIGGDFVFTVSLNYPPGSDYGLIIAAWVTAYNYLNLQAALVVTPTPGTITATMLGAVCRSVQRVVMNGLGLTVRYTFKITTITSP